MNSSNICAPDLSVENPRSPMQKMGNLIWIPRMIDKARAFKADCLGEFMYPCPMDQVFLDFLEVDGDAFANLAQSKTDDVMEDWLNHHLQNTPLQKQSEVNQTLLKKQPDTEEKWEKFKRIRDDIDPSRADITTWVALIELEEGRQS